MNHLNDAYIRSVYTNLKGKYPATARNFAILKLAVADAELKKKYEKKAGDHNKKLITSLYADSGFDIMLPEDVTFEDENSTFVDFGIKAEMIYCEVDYDYALSSPFLLHPRSSISKSPLMLSNHTGVIDAGYRGQIIGAFRNLDTQRACKVDMDTRLLQICHPSLCPIFILFVEEADLSKTERDTGGFGSTGAK